MKNYKQILEAVKRGINLALDGFEDQDDIQQLTHGNIKSSNISKDIKDFWNLFVDLGLPSGTRWFKYNLGCDFDLLNNNPDQATVNDWYGKYYSWGEIEPKSHYGETTYKFKFKLTKYNNDDNLTRILPEDDAATIAFKNTNVHIPTTEQWNELLNATHRYIVNYHGVMGYIFTSKINENKIFIPFAGYYFGGNKRDDNSEKAILMTSDLSNYGNRKDLCTSVILELFNSYISNTLYRSCGFSVRPVLNL